MVKVELSLVNVPAVVVYTLENAYVMEGVLWLVHDEEEDIVEGYPLHTLYNFKLTTLEDATDEQT